jgi:hypothetical protein
MPSISQNIRGALTARALSAPGMPTDDTLISYEGVTFAPPAPFKDVTWVRLSFMPVSIRPFAVNNKSKQHIGLFQVSLFWANEGDPGTGALEAWGDAVRAVFNPGTDLFQNGTHVRVRYAERASVNDDEPGWMHCPVSIGWQCFNAAT